jgi:hypothetical protein
MFVFGSGNLWGIPLTDSAGVAIVNPTPSLFGTLQDISADLSFDTKMLHGQNQFPVAIGRGKGKLSLKAKFARVNGLLINTLFFGQTLNANGIADNYDTTGAAIPTTPFQITPTVPQSGTWTVDLGVRNAAGNQMTRVASAPATGQYSVAAGIYTFAAADTGLIVFIDYQYTFTSTIAKKSTVLNVPMGNIPTFRTEVQTSYQGKQFVLTFPQCVGSKLAFATKLDDFMIPEFDIEAFADASGNVVTYSTAE